MHQTWKVLQMLNLVNKKDSVTKLMILWFNPFNATGLFYIILENIRKPDFLQCFRGFWKTISMKCVNMKLTMHLVSKIWSKFIVCQSSNLHLTTKLYAFFQCLDLENRLSGSQIYCFLTLLRRRSLFLINWFLYDCDLRHERVKTGQYQWGQGMFFLYKSLSKSTIRFF